MGRKEWLVKEKLKGINLDVKDTNELMAFFGKVGVKSFGEKSIRYIFWRIMKETDECDFILMSYSSIMGSVTNLVWEGKKSDESEVALSHFRLMRYLECGPLVSISMRCRADQFFFYANGKYVTLHLERTATTPVLLSSSRGLLSKHGFISRDWLVHNR